MLEQSDLFLVYIKAASPLTDPHTLTVLALTDWVPIRRRVGGNRSTPVSVLEQLSLDEVDEVRIAVACNPMTPPTVLDHIIDTASVEVRTAIARDSEAHTYVLQKLSADENSTVRSCAKLTLRLFNAPGTSSEIPIALNQIFSPDSLKQGLQKRSG